MNLSSRQRRALASICNTFTPGGMQMRYSTEHADLDGAGYRDSGEVRVGKDGEPTVRYSLSGRDARHLHAGVAGAARILAAAGAKSLVTGHRNGPAWRAGDDLQTFIADAERAGYAPGRCTMAALHLVGTARMDGDPSTSAVNPDGATWEIPNVVVVDAATFPTSSGVNPMISIEAIAYMNASRLASRLASAT
jgi:choline dehydrogenase-like flavoprotein